LLFRSQTIPAGSKGADQRFVAGNKRDLYSIAALLEKMVKFFIVEKKTQLSTKSYMCRGVP
jgi:hypothetical protein